MWSRLPLLARRLSCRFGSVFSRASSTTGSIMAIESSCDDSCVARMALAPPFKFAHQSAGQMEAHAPYGGVVPPVAARAHMANLPQLLEALDTSFTDDGAHPKDIAVAVTVGPGLSPCLRVGVANAHRYAYRKKIPIVPVHHIEAHLLVSRHPKVSQVTPAFPFLALVLTGGHTQLLLARDVGNYQLLGETLDDAIGEAFDKVARILGLSHPTAYGAALEQEAAKYVITSSPKSEEKCEKQISIQFPVPMRHLKNCDFSFAGLKTAVRYQINHILKRDGVDKLPDIYVPEIANAFQRTVTIHLIERTRRAIEWSRKLEPSAKHVVVCGGVASNKYIRAQIVDTVTQLGMEPVFPDPRFCTDNAVMVAWAAYEKIIHHQKRSSSTSYPKSLDEVVRELSIENLLTEENAATTEETSLRKIVQVTARWPLSEPISEDQIKELNRKDNPLLTPKRTTLPELVTPETPRHLLDRFKDMIKNLLFR